MENKLLSLHAVKEKTTEKLLFMFTEWGRQWSVSEERFVIDG